MIRSLSWGCGVQSTTLGEMAAQGLLDPLDVIISADPGWERRATYEMRDWYAARWREMGQRVEIIQTGDIRKQGAEEHIHIPFWTETGGPLRRQCTIEFKIRPIRRRLRELAGYHASRPPHPKPGEIETWLGISLDEAKRARPNQVKFQVTRWPLLELKMTRQDCVDWLIERKLPVPPKSACICCPYRRASEWLQIRDEAPDEFQAAIEFDEVNRHNPLAERGHITASQFYIFSVGSVPMPLRTADLERWAATEKEIYGVQIPFMAECESGQCWI